jgi:prepilin-type N-terminal cleavage/methylation domain-containing protein/prepilin-type processing-associated H-X9-DG protein
MNRKAFTLVELLVVIVIIGILMGLLLPAVQMAREAARRASCSNNIKNLSLAALNYETVNKVLPSHMDKYGMPPDDNVSWIIPLLPYIEQTNLWTELLTTPRLEVRIKLTVCPSNPPENTADKTALSYVCNKEVFITELTGMSVGAISRHDGAAQTLMLAERIFPDIIPDGRKWHADPTGTTVPDCVWFDDPNYPVVSGDPLQRPVFTPAKDMISSKHGSGCNVSFCDGHVVFLRQDIDVHYMTGAVSPTEPTLYQALCSPNGGEITDDTLY